jgi:hypothetical protein
VHARVACDPDELRSTVLAIVTEVVQTMGATAEFRNTQSFRPGRPVPTHRVTELTD